MKVKVWRGICTGAKRRKCKCGGGKGVEWGLSCASLNGSLRLFGMVVLTPADGLWFIKFVAAVDFIVGNGFIHRGSCGGGIIVLGLRWVVDSGGSVRLESVVDGIDFLVTGWRRHS